MKEINFWPALRLDEVAAMLKRPEDFADDYYLYPPLDLRRYKAAAMDKVILLFTDTESSNEQNPQT
jgi:hypothetical protein